MSVFAEAEVAYLREQTLGRIATVGSDGQPHITPVTFFHNEVEDTIDVGGLFFGGTKKWRDARRNPRVALLVDEALSNPRRARALEIRGTAELHETGGEEANPRFRTSPRSSSESDPFGSWPGDWRSRPPEARAFR